MFKETTKANGKYSRFQQEMCKLTWQLASPRQWPLALLSLEPGSVLGLGLGELVLDAVVIGILVPCDNAGVLAPVPDRDLGKGAKVESPLTSIDHGISPEFLMKQVYYVVITGEFHNV